MTRLQDAFEGITQQYHADEIDEKEYLGRARALADARDDWAATAAVKAAGRSALSTVPSAMVGLGRAFGGDALAEKGEEWERDINEMIQVNPDQDENFTTKLGGGFGSLAGLIATGGGAGLAARGVVGAASKLNKVNRAARTLARSGDEAGATAARAQAKAQAMRTADKVQPFVTKPTLLATGAGLTASEGARDYEATMARDGTPMDYAMRQKAAQANLPAGVLDYVLPAKFLAKGSKLFNKPEKELKDLIIAGKDVKPAKKAATAKGAAAGAATEGITEGVQQAWLNEAARRLYDQERDVTDGVLESAAIGGITGGFVRGAQEYNAARKYENTYEAAQRSIEADEADKAAAVQQAEADKAAADEQAAVEARNAALDTRLEASGFVPETQEDLVAQGMPEADAKQMAKDLQERLAKQPQDIQERASFDPTVTEDEYVAAHPEMEKAKAVGVERTSTGEGKKKRWTTKVVDAEANADAIAEADADLRERYKLLQADAQPRVEAAATAAAARETESFDPAVSEKDYIANHPERQAILDEHMVAKTTRDAAGEATTKKVLEKKEERDAKLDAKEAELADRYARLQAIATEGVAPAPAAPAAPVVASPPTSGALEVEAQGIEEPVDMEAIAAEAAQNKVLDREVAELPVASQETPETLVQQPEQPVVASRSILDVTPQEARREVAGTMSIVQANRVLHGKSPHFVAGRVVGALRREAEQKPKHGDKGLLEAYRAATPYAFAPSNVTPVQDEGALQDHRNRREFGVPVGGPYSDVPAAEQMRQLPPPATVTRVNGEGFASEKVATNYIKRRGFADTHVAVQNEDGKWVGVASGERPQFALGAQPAVRAPNADAAIAKEVIRRNNILKNNGVGVKVTVIDDPANTPEEVARDLNPGDQPRAVLVGDQVYLFSYNLNDEHEARRAIAHEIVGHHGVEGLYGNNKEAFGKALDKLYGGLSDKVLVNTIKASYGSRVDTKTQEGRRTLVKEYIAHKAEDGYATDPGFFKGLYAAVRQHLRKWGILNMPDAEIQQLLADSYKRTVGRKALNAVGIPEEDVAYMKAWTGYRNAYAEAKPQFALKSDPLTEGVAKAVNRTTAEDSAFTSFFRNLTDNAIAKVPRLRHILQTIDDQINASWSRLPEGARKAAIGFRDMTLGAVDEAQTFGNALVSRADKYSPEQLHLINAWIDNGGLMHMPTDADIAANPPPAFLQPDDEIALREARNVLTETGEKMVKLHGEFGGWLTKEIFESNRDLYAPVIYADYILNSGSVGGKKISRQDYLKRKNLTGLDFDTAVQKAVLGEITDPFFRLGQGIAATGRDAALGRYMGNLTNHPQLVLPEAFSHLPNPMRGGEPITLPDAIEVLARNGYMVNPTGEVVRKLSGRHTYQPDQAVREGAAAEIQKLADAVSEQLRTPVEVNGEMVEGGVQSLIGGDMEGPDMLKALRDDYVLVKGHRFGELDGRIIRKEISDDINEVINPATEADHPVWAVVKELTAKWKALKVPLNPVSQIRNGVGNFFLLDIGSDASIQTLAKDTAKMMRSFVDIKQGDLEEHKMRLDVLGPNATDETVARWLVREMGGGATTFAAAESLGQRSEIDKAVKAFEKIGTEGKGSIATSLAVTKWFHDFVGKPAGKYSDFMMDKYQLMETVFKAVAVKDYLRRVARQSNAGSIPEMVKSLTVDGERTPELQALMNNSMAHANETIFDYSRVSPTVNMLRRSPIGMPFLTFTLKAIPATVKAHAYRPHKMIKYYAIPYLLAGASTGWDDDEMEEVMKSMPEWQRNSGSLWATPFKQDDGKYFVTDIGYMLPQSGMVNTIKALLNFNQFENPTDAFVQAGNAMLGTTTEMAGAPLWSLFSAITSGEDPFTKRPIVREGATADDKLYDTLTYAYDFVAPSIISSNSGIVQAFQQIGIPGFEEKVNPRTGEPTRSLGQNALRTIGINTYNIDLHQGRMINRRVARYNLQKAERELQRQLRDQNNAGKRQEIILEYRPHIDYLRKKAAAA